MGLNADVSWRALSLGSRDSTTGWRAKNYADAETIKMAISNPATRSMVVSAGFHPHYTYSGFHIDPVSEGDQTIDKSNNYYEIKTSVPIPFLDSLMYYESELSLLPFEPIDAISLPSPSEYDARYLTKVYLDNYLNISGVNFACLFEKPNYPMQLEFKGASNMDLLFLIGQPNSEPNIDFDKTTCGYEEKVPITISCVNKFTDIQTTQLLQIGEDALRKVLQDHPEGASLRTLGVMRDRTEHLGSTILYSRECIMNYSREIS